MCYLLVVVSHYHKTLFIIASFGARVLRKAQVSPTPLFVHFQLLLGYLRYVTNNFKGSIQRFGDVNRSDSQMTRTVALPFPRVWDDDISMLLRRSSAFVSSCRLFWSRSDGRGHGSHAFIESRVPERARDAGRLRIDAPRWCEGVLRGVAV